MYESDCFLIAKLLNYYDLRSHPYLFLMVFESGAIAAIKTHR